MQRQLSPQENCMLLNAVARVSIGENEQAKLTGHRNDVNALVKGLTYPEIVALSQRYPDKASRPCN
ncbi:hypothetical protein D0B54_22855 [Solimonas sp. K1W22B-7]|uniref:hypothetical protein n=1 Tax=Solimonas sp. K1W22B-7 TaxID=2303331 RepID=UPI000E331D36|nr:hypothetical protein [Solimonas sp. K1W22B-7]AXQ31349.1 hypothetical protein D0B54_22855 [Solimonas sp. K1W22B-7]